MWQTVAGSLMVSVCRSESPSYGRQNHRGGSLVRGGGGDLVLPGGGRQEQDGPGLEAEHEAGGH